MRWISGVPSKIVKILAGQAESPASPLPTLTRAKI
jgi:hypothetical protein